jgi:hypothetical protein
MNSGLVDIVIMPLTEPELKTSCDAFDGYRLRRINIDYPSAAVITLNCLHHRTRAS